MSLTGQNISKPSGRVKSIITLINVHLGRTYGHLLFEFSGALATAKVGAPTLKVGESTVYDVAAEGKVVPMLGLTDTQPEQPAMLPFASVLTSKTSAPPAPKLVVDAATMYPPSEVCRT